MLAEIIFGFALAGSTIVFILKAAIGGDHEEA